jgi:hypothetical protein
MLLPEKGRYYQLPIAGLEIKKLVYDGLLRIVFNDQEQSYLDLHGEFEITQHNQKSILSPKSKEALLLFYNLFGVPIKDAKADKFGRLFLRFDNGLEIIVEDGLYENWHYTKIDAKNPKDNLFVHGGVGKTIF